VRWEPDKVRGEPVSDLQILMILLQQNKKRGSKEKCHAEAKLRGRSQASTSQHIADFSNRVARDFINFQKGQNNRKEALWA
jgi:hypothetical protein